MNRNIRIFIVIASLLLTAGFAAGADKEKSGSWLDRFKLNGDLRLRYEGFDQEGRYDDGRRDRFRIRLRAGFGFQVRDDLKIGFQLRSGDSSDPVSDNQSLDGGFSKKEIAIAEAYADWQAHDNVSIIAGKFAPKKLWMVSDMQWDDDVVVEGAMERFLMKGSGETFKKLEASVYQFVLDEDSTSEDGYLFGAQVRPTFKLTDKNELTFGVGYENYSRPQEVVGLTAGDTISGNRITNLLDGEGNLVSDFRIASAFFQWKNKTSKKWPVKVSFFYYKNTGAKSEIGEETSVDNAVGAGDDNDTAFFARVQVGDYKKPGQMAFRLSKYDSEPDALFYAYTQSDTTRASNVDGLRFDFRIGMPAKGYINVTWYNTKPTLGDFSTMDRWQVDYIFRF
jgi:hypothetical protein